MSQVSSAIGVGRVGAPTFASHIRAAARSDAASQATWKSAPASDDSTPARHDLFELNGALSRSSEVSNALSTAHDALGVIGSLLGNVGAVLAAAASSADSTFDRATDQGRVDGAMVTIDAVAGSARFGGRNLLDGSYQASGATGSMQLPSFASKDLGIDPMSQPGNALTSLKSGGINDLASGRLETAGRVVASALSRVVETQGKIAAFTGSSATISQSEIPAPPAGITPTELIASAAKEMLADPGLSAVAMANSNGNRVLALLQP